MKAAVQESPAKSGIELANWNWKVVRQFVSEKVLGISLSRSSLPELPPPLWDSCSEAPQETSGEG